MSEPRGSADGQVAAADPTRLNLYRYATADNAPDYIAIMELFTETLLTDLSAGEVAAHLAGRGLTLSAEDVQLRCEALERWGNLVRSVRDARAATVADFLRSRYRFQVSKLGGRVHRQVAEIIRATTGVREVARELLGGMVDTLDRILERLADGGAAGDVDALAGDVDALAGDVTGLFNDQRLFTESARDFYAYLHQVLSRYDLLAEEYAKFKDLLLSYVDLLTADVARHAPALTDRLHRVLPHLDRLLAALETLPTLTNADGEAAERSPGRAWTDWEELAAWYDAGSGRAGPQQLRRAADQALGQLLANAKRMLAAAGTGVSRRADLLRLARWFLDSTDDDAHQLYAAAFGAYPARHLALGPEELSPRAGATTSWWDADPVDVPISLRERGDRAARGRTAGVPDPGLDREEMLAQAAAERARDRAAAAELVAIGTLDGARVTPAARDMLLDRLGELFAIDQDGTEPQLAVDTDLGFVVHALPAPGALTVVHSDDGDLSVDGLRLAVAGIDDAPAPSVSAQLGAR